MKTSTAVSIVNSILLVTAVVGIGLSLGWGAGFGFTALAMYLRATLYSIANSFRRPLL